MGEPILDARTYFSLIHTGGVPKDALTTDQIGHLENAIESCKDLESLGNLVLGIIYENRSAAKALGRYLRCLMAEADGHDCKYQTEALQRMEALAPQHPFFGNLLLGQVYEALSDTDAAMRHYRACMQQQPTTEAQRRHQREALKRLHDLES